MGGFTDISLFLNKDLLNKAEKYGIDPSIVICKYDEDFDQVISTMSNIIENVDEYISSSEDFIDLVENLSITDIGNNEFEFSISKYIDDDFGSDWSEREFCFNWNIDKCSQYFNQ